MVVQHVWECTSTSVQDFATTVVDTTSQLCHSIQDFFEERQPAFLAGVEQVEHIALPILAGLASATLFAAQSSFFVVGFLVSVLKPQVIQYSIHEISKYWNMQHIDVRFAVVVRCAIVAAAAVAWPISLAASAFFVGGGIGLLLQHQDGKEPSELLEVTLPVETEVQAQPV